MKTPHSPGGKWPAIENPKLKGLHSTTCDLCNKGNSNLGFRTALSSSDYQTILFSLLTMIHSHSGFYRNWNNKQLNSGFLYHPLISHSIWDRQTILFRQGLFLCFRISFGSFVFFFFESWHFHVSGFLTGEVSPLVFHHIIPFPAPVLEVSSTVIRLCCLAQPSRTLCWRTHCRHINQGRREEFTGTFQITPVKSVQLGVPFSQSAS